MIEIKTNINILIDKENPEKCAIKCRYAKYDFSGYRCKLFDCPTQLTRAKECVELFGVPKIGLIKANVTVGF